MNGRHTEADARIAIDDRLRHAGWDPLDKSIVGTEVQVAEPSSVSGMPERSRHKELVRLYHALAGFRVPADVLVYAHEDIDYWRDSFDHVLARGLREGRVLYERP